MACVYQSQVQVKRSQIAANSENARSSRYIAVPSIDSATTSSPNSSTSTTDQGALDIVILPFLFYFVSQNSLSHVAYFLMCK